MNLLWFDLLDSTSTHAKALAKQGAAEWTAVAADRQTAGRGRKGRTFFSPKGSGLYMSVVLRPKASAMAALDITTATAVAVVRVLERKFASDFGIKWVNDIYKDGRKVCGILAESALTGDGSVDYVILGIGINLFPSAEPTPPEIKDIIGYVCDTETDVDKAALCGEILTQFKEIYDRLDEKDFYKEYTERMFLTGRTVTVINEGEEREALVLGTDDRLGLKVRFSCGEEVTLSAGEVSIKL